MACDEILLSWEDSFSPKLVSNDNGDKIVELKDVCCCSTFLSLI